MSNTDQLDGLRQPLRVLFFGRRCRLSARPLQALLEAGTAVAAVVIPAPRSGGGRPPLLRQRLTLPVVAVHGALELEQLASAYRVPILEARTLRAPEVTGVLRGLDVDILVVSCFPWRLPGELVSAAPLGGLNLHPSALPAYRGPDPLFWIYRHGRLRTGVTVHHLTTELDAGPIVEQARFDLPLGFPGDRLEHLVAGIGARLLVRAIGALSRGQVQAWAQPLQHASYFPWPQEDDLVIQPDWSAWRAVHFINGVVPLGYRPVYLHSGGQRTAIRRLLRWCRSRAEATAQQRPGTAVLPVRDGWLLVEEGVAERAR